MSYESIQTIDSTNYSLFETPDQFATYLYGKSYIVEQTIDLGSSIVLFVLIDDERCVFVSQSVGKSLLLHI